jgi:hypothetical protein
MDLEGKVMGYNKKIVAIAVLVLAGLVIFYAGTRYEKMRINSAISKNAKTEEKPSSKKNKTAPATPIETQTAPETNATTTPIPPMPATVPATK